MPEEKQSFYSTGDMAQMCDVSVRTVQYYDEKGLLAPSSTTWGGRRQYTDADVQLLRTIILLKSCGLKLATIRDILGDNASTQVLTQLLRDQKERLGEEVTQKKQALARLERIVSSLEKTGTLPAESVSGIDDIMQTEKSLKRLRIKMLTVGLIVDVIEWGTIIYGIIEKTWLVPVLAIVFIALPLSAYGVKIYRDGVAYVCPHCNEVFLPPWKEWFFARHTLRTRKQTCTKCGVRDWCLEVSSDRLN